MKTQQLKQYKFIGQLLGIFVFALLLKSCAMDQMDSSPIATFNTQFYPRSEYKYILDASNSFSPENGDKLSFRWNIEVDNENETWDTQWDITPTVIAIGQREKSFMHVGLQVKDIHGTLFTYYDLLWNPTRYNINDPDVSDFIKNSETSTYEIKNRSRTFQNDKFEIKEITFNQAYILYNIQAIEQSKVIAKWAYENLQLPSMSGITNIDDPMPFIKTQNLPRGSYISWNMMNRLKENEFSLPSVKDWENMFKFCCGKEVAGYNLLVNVEHGLRLSPEGYYTKENGLNEYETAGYYWTSTEASDSTAYAIKVKVGQDKAEIIELPKHYQLSIRIL